jgi:hypothetical protein
MNSQLWLNVRATRQNRFSPSVAARFLFACHPAPAQLICDGRSEPKPDACHNQQGASQAGALCRGLDWLAAALRAGRYSTL